MKVKRFNPYSTAVAEDAKRLAMMGPRPSAFRTRDGDGKVVASKADGAAPGDKAALSCGLGP